MRRPAARPWRSAAGALSLLWALGAPGAAQASPQERFAAGHAAALTGDADGAAAHFVAAAEAGGRDPAVYHALGNALYRAKQPGRAAAAWRRGLRLAPRDADLGANLERVRAASADKLDPPRGPSGAIFWAGLLSVRELALAGGLGLSAALGLLLWAQLRRRPAGLAPVGLGLVGAVLLGSAFVIDDQQDTVFVVVPEVVARSALGPDGVELFSLHEAAELAVVERSGDSVLVSLPDARKGWLPASAVLSTAPSAPFPLGEAPGPQPASSGL
jgi:hypothetical protein